MLPLKESCMQSRLKTECRSQNSEFRSSQFRSSKRDASYVEVESNRNGARCGFDDCGIHASRQEFQPHRSRLYPDPAIGQSLRAVQKSDTCSNDGYDYADLYTPDSIFIDKFSPDGATGRVYLIMLGVQGPGSITRDGGYEDVYVRTVAGWRIKSRTHVRTRAWHNPLLQTPDL